MLRFNHFTDSMFYCSIFPSSIVPLFLCHPCSFTFCLIENNDKPLSVFKVTNGIRLKVDDFVQNYELVITIRQRLVRLHSLTVKLLISCFFKHLKYSQVLNDLIFVLFPMQFNTHF